LADGILQVIHGYLGDRGLMLRQGTVVDATIIHAPSSTKNKDGKRDPEMHQTKKGNMYFFGMKAHIGVDAESGLVHSLVGTAANVADVTQVDQLMHGEETYELTHVPTQGCPPKSAQIQHRQWFAKSQTGSVISRQLARFGVGANSSASAATKCPASTAVVCTTPREGEYPDSN
jgi:hypothetical protein